MNKKLTLCNFKSGGKQVGDFTQFDLLVGRNNSGKSTVLKAMAIWECSADEFRQPRIGTNLQQLFGFPDQLPTQSILN